jgi:hypothetical protein
MAAVPAVSNPLVGAAVYGRGRSSVLSRLRPAEKTSFETLTEFQSVLVAELLSRGGRLMYGALQGMTKRQTTTR